MRKVYCDVCGKLVNHVTSWLSSCYSQPDHQDFYFAAQEKTKGDICPICNERLKKVVHDEIEKIKEEFKNENDPGRVQQIET